MVCNDLPYDLSPCSARKGSKAENSWSPALDLNFSIFRYVSGLCTGVTLLTCQCSWLKRQTFNGRNMGDVYISAGYLCTDQRAYICYSQSHFSFDIPCEGLIYTNNIILVS